MKNKFMISSQILSYILLILKNLKHFVSSFYGNDENNLHDGNEGYGRETIMTFVNC